MKLSTLFFSFIFTILIGIPQIHAADLSTETLLLGVGNQIHELNPVYFGTTSNVSEGRSFWQYSDGNMYTYSVKFISFSMKEKYFDEEFETDFKSSNTELSAMIDSAEKYLLAQGFEKNNENTRNREQVKEGDDQIVYAGFQRKNAACVVGKFWFSYDLNIYCLEDITMPADASMKELALLYDMFDIHGRDSAIGGINKFGDFWELITSYPYGAGGTSYSVKKVGNTFIKLYGSRGPSCSLVERFQIPKDFYYEGCINANVYIKDQNILSEFQKKISSSVNKVTTQKRGSMNWIYGKNLETISAQTISLSIENLDEQKLLQGLFPIIEEAFSDWGFDEDLKQSFETNTMGKNFPELYYWGFTRGTYKCSLEGTLNEGGTSTMYLSCGYGQLTTQDLTLDVDKKIRLALDLSDNYKGSIAGLKEENGFLAVNFQYRIGPAVNYILKKDENGNLKKVLSMVGDCPDHDVIASLKVPESLLGACKFVK